jgi:hypothetical protein
VSTIGLIVVLVLCGLAWWGTTQFPEIGPMARLIRFVLIVVAILCTLFWVLAFAGVASPFAHARLP